MASKTEHDLYVHPGPRYASRGVRLGDGQGMALRDWFAGQALAGLVTRYADDMKHRASEKNLGWSFFDLERDDRPDESLAMTAYEIADTMLKVREDL